MIFYKHTSVAIYKHFIVVEVDAGAELIKFFLQCYSAITFFMLQPSQPANAGNAFAMRSKCNQWRKQVGTVCCIKFKCGELLSFYIHFIVAYLNIRSGIEY